MFPPHDYAEPGGLLAVGGDLSVERLLSAYSQGIFPWYEYGQPILWWSPDPRLVLFPQNFKLHRSLKKTLRKQIFQVKTDTAFRQVIHQCGQSRVSKGEGTWITTDMEEAYSRLFELGVAHTVETWMNGQLVGGLYGVSLGKCFFGESMFSLVNDASKVAFTALVEQMKRWEYHFIDCQVTTNHLLRFGAVEITRPEFLQLLQLGLKRQTRLGKWSWGDEISQHLSEL